MKLNINKKMRILVTGADGFLGSHLVEHLVRKGFKVRALVLYNSFNSWGWIDNLPEKIKKKIEVVMGDIRDKEAIIDYFENVQIVINLAALIAIPYSYLAARSYIDTNIIGTLNILNTCKEKKIKQLIQISTSEVYGSPKRLPLTEDAEISAYSPYAATKIASDQLALSFYRSFGLPVTVIRPFNTYGPRQSARAVIPSIITQVLKNKFVKIGSTYPTRDFLFVEDTIQGITAAIGKKKSLGEIINLGTGYEISIRNLIIKISKLCGIKANLKLEKIRTRPKNSEVERLLASTQKAKKILNWKPQYAKSTGLDQGLKKTIEWFKHKENLRFYKTSEFIY